MWAAATFTKADGKGIGKVATGMLMAARPPLALSGGKRARMLVRVMKALAELESKMKKASTPTIRPRVVGGTPSLATCPVRSAAAEYHGR